MLADMVLPEVKVTIHPNGHNRWIFDYRVTFEFAEQDDFEEKHAIYSSRTSGVILDQDNNQYSGVYQGPSFPAVAARRAPLVPNPDPITRTKPIPLALVRQKFDEFINNRNDIDTDHNPPLRRIRLHNSGKYNDGAFPESYLDLRSIIAGRETVNYVSSPTSLGQLSADGVTNTVYFIDVNSDALSISADSAQPPIFTFGIHFETGGPEETAGLFNMDITDFSITLKLTLVKLMTDDGRTVVDVLNWINELRDLDATATSAGKRAGYSQPWPARAAVTRAEARAAGGPAWPGRPLRPGGRAGQGWRGPRAGRGGRRPGRRSGEGCRRDGSGFRLPGSCRRWSGRVPARSGSW